jgi:hypothetical protein
MGRRPAGTIELHGHRQHRIPRRRIRAHRLDIEIHFLHRLIGEALGVVPLRIERHTREPPKERIARERTRTVEVRLPRDEHSGRRTGRRHVPVDDRIRRIGGTDRRGRLAATGRHHTHHEHSHETRHASPRGECRATK